MEQNDLPIDNHVARLKAHLHQECGGPVAQREQIASALSSIPIMKRREIVFLWRIRRLKIILLAIVAIILLFIYYKVKNV